MLDNITLVELPPLRYPFQVVHAVPTIADNVASTILTKFVDERRAHLGRRYDLFRGEIVPVLRSGTTKVPLKEEPGIIDGGGDVVLLIVLNFLDDFLSCFDRM